MRIIFILLLLFLAGCSGDNGGIDAGEDAGWDAGEEKAGDGDPGTDRAEDGGYGDDYDYGDDGGMGDDGGFGDDAGSGDDGGIVVDEDLGDDLGLMIPAGMCMCGSTGVNPIDFPASFERKGQVCFRAGLHRMQKDMRSFEIDLIESVEVGPEAVVGVPSGAGVFTVSPPAQPDGDYSFMFEQEFSVDGTPFVFSIQLTYPCANSEPTVDVVTLDDAGLCDRLFFTSASWGDTPLYMGTCQYSLYYCGILKVNLEGGDWLKVENCNYCPKDWMCKANPAGMRRAEFSDGQSSIYQGDYFGLVHSMRHHNWGNDSLARFDQALGGVQAVYVGTNQYPDHVGYSQATYLDGDLNVLETRSVTSVEYPGAW